jgi:hypothetical protein
MNSLGKMKILTGSSAGWAGAGRRRSETAEPLRFLLDPKKHREAKQEPGHRFADWLASSEGQAAIGAYKINGEQMFHPSAVAPK